MKYIGSKAKFADEIVAILQGYISEYKIKQYVEPFAGGFTVEHVIVYTRRNIVVFRRFVADISRQIHRRRIHRVLSNGGRRLVVANCRGFQNNVVYPASTCVRTHDKVLRQNRTIVIVCPPSRNRGNDQRRRVVITRRTPRVVGL